MVIEMLPIREVVEINYSIGMGKPTLSELINDMIRDMLHKREYICIDIKILNQRSALLLFTNKY